MKRRRKIHLSLTNFHPFSLCFTSDMATAVREDNDRDSGATSRYGKQAGSLLAAMLKSVGEASVNADSEPTHDTSIMVEEAVEKGADTTKPEDANTEDETLTTASSTKKPMQMDIDDDEEEQPTVLHSEFESLNDERRKEYSSLKAEPAESNRRAEEEPEPEITDLSMAIKSKKSKAKKKSKK
jgi:hypothetical protein